MYINTYEHSLKQLDTHQIRILGTLCEKQLSGFRSYPLTVNDTRLACNQKSGRHPQMAMTTEEVQEAANVLASRQLITIDRSGRTERYAHCLNTALNVDRATLAILTAVMLRGPLSVALIRSSTGRLYPFASKQEIEQLVNANRVFAIAPREPGQRGHRYIQAIEAQLRPSESIAKPEPVAVGQPSSGLHDVRKDLDQLQTLLEPKSKNGVPQRQ